MPQVDIEPTLWPRWRCFFTVGTLSALLCCAPGTTAQTNGGLCPTCSLTFGASHLIADGLPGATQREPSVAIDGKGGVWVAYADYGTPGVNSAVMRVIHSTDQGQTFSPVGTALCGHDNCGNPLLAIDSQDRVFLSYGALDLGTPSPRYMMLARVDSRADNPHAPPMVVSDDAIPRADRQWLSVGPDDSLYFVWKAGYQDPLGDIRLRRSDNHGVSFQPTVIVAGDLGGYRPLYAAIAVEPSGGVAVAIAAGTPDYTSVKQVYFTRSTDRGLTFSAPVSLGATAQRPIPGPFGTMAGVFINFPAIAVSNRATHVVWPQQSAADPDVIDVVSTTRFDGVQFSAPARVNDDRSNGVHLQPAIACDERGLLIATWLDSRGWNGSANKPWKVFGALSRDEGASFLPNVDLGVPLFAGDQGVQEGAQATGEFNGVAARNGRVYAAWTDTTNGDPNIYLSAGTLNP
jgi:hypothetical protein